jgi:hypothetical protein
MPMYFGRWYTPLGGSRYKVLGLHGYNTRYAMETPNPPQNPPLSPTLIFQERKNLASFLRVNPTRVQPYSDPPGSSPSFPATMEPSIQSVVSTLGKIGITKGDLLFTFDRNNPVNQHVVMVVGWGPYADTWAQVGRVTRGQIQPNAGPNLVPYVVDHGPQGKYSLDNPSMDFSYVVRLGYRPYYAISWQLFPGDTSYFIDTAVNERYFIKMPDRFQIPSDDVVQPNGTTNLLSRMLGICPQ